MPDGTPRSVDPRQPRFGQFLTGTLALVAFVLRWPQLFAVLALVLGLGALSPALNLWAHLYRGFRSLARLGPPRELEDAGPPRFAMVLGFVAFSLAGGLYVLGAEGAAYGIAAVIVVLGYLGAAGLCVGCEIYLWGRRFAARRTQRVGA